MEEQRKNGKRKEKETIRLEEQPTEHTTFRNRNQREKIEEITKLDQTEREREMLYLTGNQR
jgi:hypothetical protein